MMLFVRPSHWGTPVARDLHAAMVEAAAGRGFTGLRLFTPAGQRRARRFYEREGWRAVREFHAPHLELDVVEYRRGCPTPS
jgi:GNAT superfamily N-acetyltransferase